MTAPRQCSGNCGSQRSNPGKASHSPPYLTDAANCWQGRELEWCHCTAQEMAHCEAAGMAQLWCSCSCPVSPSMWHFHPYIIWMHPSYNIFCWGISFKSLSTGQLFPHTLHFCFSPEMANKSSWELLPAEDRRYLLITHCHGCWHSPTLQLLPTVSFQPTDLSKDLLLPPCCPQSAPLPALAPSLQLTSLPHTSESHSLPLWCWPIQHIKNFSASHQATI